MRFKLTLSLLVANLAVFFLLWKLNQPVVIQAPPPLLSLSFGDVDQILIEDHSTPTVSVRELSRKRGQEDWRILKPVDWPANQAAVLRLLNDLRFPGAKEETTFSLPEVQKTGQTLKDYGLESPRLSVTLSAGEQRQVVLVGNSTMDDTHVYVRNPADDLIRVLPKEWLASIDVPLADLRDPQVFTLRYSTIQGLSLRGAIAQPGAAQAADAPLVRFVKDGANWRLESPSQAPADTPLVNAVVGQLLALSTDHFVGPDEMDAANRGLASPSLRIELRGEDRQTLLLGEKVPNTDPAQYYGKLEESPALFVVNAPRNPLLFKVLENAQADLRDHKFVNFDPDKVKAITLQFTNEKELRLQKLETGADPWRVLVGDANAIPADTTIVQGLLTDLRNLQAVSFPRDSASADDLHTYGFDPPQWRVTLQMDKQDKPAVLLLGIRPGTPTNYYAKLEDAPSIYEIPPPIFGKLKLDPLYYRSRTLEELPAAAQISSLKLVRLNRDLTPVDGPPVFDYAVSAQKPTLADVLKDVPASTRDAVGVVRDMVRKFQVAGYQQDTFTDHYMFPDNALGIVEATWIYRLDAGITFPAAGQTPEQKQTRTYYISRRFGGSLEFGGRREPPPAGIFRLTPALIDALATLTESQPPPANAEQVLQQMNQPIDPRAAPPLVVPGGTPPPLAPLAPVTPASPSP